MEKVKRTGLARDWGYIGIFVLMTGNIADAITTGVAVTSTGWSEVNPVLVLGFNIIGVGLTLLLKVIIGTVICLLLIEAYNKLHPTVLLVPWFFGLFFWSIVIWYIANVLVIS